MSDIAVISVIASGGVALGTVVVGGWLTERQSKRVARSARFDELRSVLDDASVALIQVVEAVGVEDLTRIEEIKGMLARTRAALHRVWQQEARIGVRLGTDSEVFVAYRAAHDAAGQLLSYYEARLRLDEPNRSLKQITAELPVAQSKFFNLAAGLTGPDRD